MGPGFVQTLSAHPRQEFSFLFPESRLRPRAIPVPIVRYGRHYRSQTDDDRRSVTAPPPSQTGQADLPHPAFQSVAITMDELRIRTKGPEVVLPAAQTFVPLTPLGAIH